MKRFFSIAFCVCIFVSVFAVSASAADSGSVNIGEYSYNFTPRDPYYVYDDSVPTIYQDGIHVLTKVHQFHVQDLSRTENTAPSADVIMPENWNPESAPVYSTTSEAGQFDKRIAISTGFYILPYNVDALSNLRVSLYATFNQRCSYSVTLRFTLSDGSRKDIIYYSPVLSDTINLSFESYAEDTLLDIPFEFPANAESVRILVSATTGYATSGAFELEQFYSDFQFVWSTEGLQNQTSVNVIGGLFAGIVELFNPNGLGGALFVPDMGAISDLINSSEGSMLDQVMVWFSELERLFDHTTEFFENYLAGFIFFSTLVGLIMEIRFLSDLIYIGLIIGAIALMFNLLGSGKSKGGTQ